MAASASGGHTFEQDGLIRGLPDSEFDWLAAQLHDGMEPDEQLTELVRWAVELHLANEVVWPAVIDGSLVPPPDAHILHTLVQVNLLDVASYSEFADELAYRPDPWTVAPVGELPTCDLCKGPIAQPARYDGPMSRDAQAPWAFMCPDCYRQNSTLTLGVARGQYLVTYDEISQPIRDAFYTAREYWRSRGIEVPDYDLFA